MHTDHIHSHGSDHDHVGDAHDCHEHIHGHSAGEASGASAKDTALLNYMLEHNKQHADELSRTGSRLEDAGLAEPARLIGEAVHYFAHANEKLEQAVEILRNKEN